MNYVAAWRATTLGSRLRGLYAAEAELPELGSAAPGPVVSLSHASKFELEIGRLSALLEPSTELIACLPLRTFH